MFQIFRNVYSQLGPRVAAGTDLISTRHQLLTVPQLQRRRVQPSDDEQLGRKALHTAPKKRFYKNVNVIQNSGLFEINLGEPFVIILSFRNSMI